MARVAFVPVVAGPAGVASGLITPSNAGGYSFVWTQGSVLHVKNASGSPVNVTIHTNVVYADGLTLPDRVVAIPATTGDVYIGALQQSEYAQADGTVNVDFASSASVLAEVIQAP
jgi:hypothetical protein